MLCEGVGPDIAITEGDGGEVGEGWVNLDGANVSVCVFNKCFMMRLAGTYSQSYFSFLDVHYRHSFVDRSGCS